MFQSIRWRIAIPFIVLNLAGMLGLAVYLSSYLRETYAKMPPDMPRVLTVVFLAALLETFVFSLLAVAAARRIAAPIHALAGTARQMAAGNYALKAPEISQDEIGVLAKALNSLIERIYQHVSGLEQRVIERTLDLKRKALDFQIASEVARDISLIREEESLLQQAANLIRSRLEYDHVGIYLIDNRSELAVLRASAGEGSRSMLEKNHAVQIDEKSFIGYAAATGHASVANNVKTDPMHITNPVLPETCSEASIPLRTGEQVLGVLDVQSFLENAFEQEDIAILETIADQFAVTLMNARLYGDLQSSLREIGTLYQRFTLEKWSSKVTPGQTLGYEFDRFRIAPVDFKIPEDMQTGLQAGHALVLETSQTEHEAKRSLLVAPLMMHKQIIGVIGLEDQDPQHRWPAEEVALVETVANQVALSLDNARLLEETQLRSEQLRLLQEITSAAASHIDLQELLVDVSQRLLDGYDLLNCWFLFFEPDGRTGMVIADTSKTGEAAKTKPGSRISLAGSPVIDEIIRSQKPVVVYDIQNQPGAAVFDGLMEQHGTFTAVIAPLLSLGKPIGIVGLDFGDAKRRIDKDELRLIEQISLQITGAIDVTRLFDQTQQRVERERMLSEITSKVRASTNIDVIMQTAVQELAEKLHLSSGEIQMRASEQQAAQDERR